MKNAILKICEKLRGYSENTEYFEVIKVNQNEDGNYVVVVKAVEPEENKEAENAGNK